MTTVIRKLPTYVRIMLLAYLLVVVVGFFSPVRIWTAGCSFVAMPAVIGIARSLRKEPDNQMVRLVLAAMFYFFLAFALVPFLFLLG